MATERSYGNMLNSKPVSKKPLSEDDHPKSSPWLKMGKKKENC